MQNNCHALCCQKPRNDDIFNALKVCLCIRNEKLQSCINILIQLGLLNGDDRLEGAQRCQHLYLRIILVLKPWYAYHWWYKGESNHHISKPTAVESNLELTRNPADASGKGKSTDSSTKCAFRWF